MRKWIQEESIYEAEFLTKGKKYKATFDNFGKWVETERKIRTTELPQVVKGGLAKGAYKDWKIKEAVEAESPEYKLVYELELIKGKEKIALSFTSDGKLLKKKKD